MRVCHAVLVAALSLSPLGALAQATGVDWQARTLRVKGSGAPDLAKSPNVAVARINAERAAKVDALRNAIEELKGVRLSSTSTVGSLLEDGATRAKVEAVLRGARITDTKYFEDGGVEVLIEAPLDGALVELFLPAKPASGSKASSMKSPHSGVIVDARGLNVQPALLPRLLDEEGRELYGASVASRDALRERGAAAYHDALAGARADGRAGSSPLELRASKVAGASDLVLAAEAVKKLEAATALLAGARVVILVDKEASVER